MSMVSLTGTGVSFPSCACIRQYYGNRNFPPGDMFLRSSSREVIQIVNTSSPAVSASATTHDSRQAAVVASTNGHVAPSMTRGDPVIDHEDGGRRLGLIDYFQQSAELVSATRGGAPRWFSPLECGSRLQDSPLLLFLPGVDGNGLGLILHHQRLGKFFDIWCLHIPLTDRTAFTELVKLVEGTVRAEHSHAPDRPIYLVGETFGACLALAVAARNQDIDLVLILANPATSFNKSSLLLQPQSLMPLLTIVPQQLISGMPHMLLLGALPVMAAAKTGKGLPLQEVIGEISADSVALSSYLFVLSNVMTTETLEWKLNMLKSAAAFVNSRIHAVKARTLILTSGQDTLFGSKEEGQRLGQLLSKCEIRVCDDSTRALFLQDGINMVAILNGTSFYRRTRSHDYVQDYLPHTPSEYRTLSDPFRLIDNMTDPVMLSTLESGKIVRSLEGIPQDGPVLFVGYHMLLGLELYTLIHRLLTERKVLLRGMAHPLFYYETMEGQFPAVSDFDIFRSVGAVPVTPSNFYKLFSSNSHILLYPGGFREAFHRKGEEYKLFWPEQPEFIKMAAKFGATIIPFGSVGEDDVSHLLADYDDLRKIPYINSLMEELTDKAVKLRTYTEGEVAKQPIHVPVVLPRIPPGRFYYYFGKPIHLQGKAEELKSSEKVQEMYLQVKQEVENCLAYLKEKREKDPYRSIIARLAYKAMHGSADEIPTFDL